MNQANEDFKFVVVLKKGLASGVALNALGHLSLSLMSKASEAERSSMGLIDYGTSDGELFRNISKLSLVVLSASSNKIKNLGRQADENGVLHSEFIESMTGETYVEQLERTGLLSKDEVSYFGVMLFGKADEVSNMTRKFSLWR